MTTEHDPASDLIAYVVRYMACPGCDSAYVPDGIAVVFHADNQWALNARCPVCGMDKAITAYDQPPYHRLRERERLVPGLITSTFCDEWVCYLESFTGDMYSLLAQS
jgi:hypothetical protein